LLKHAKKEEETALLQCGEKVSSVEYSVVRVKAETEREKQ
jgi:hypothetical protein